MGESRFPNYAKAPSPKRNAESDGQAAHDITVKSEKLGRSSTHAAQPQEECAFMRPLQGHPSSVPPFRGVSSNHPLCGW
jgi:hypothetical protein